LTGMQLSWGRVAALVCVSALGFGATGAAAAPKRPPVAPGSLYLALGDSVTFGYKELETVPPPNYKDQASMVGYPRMVGRELRLRVTNAACPGETTSSFINPKAVSFGCENFVGASQPSYRKDFPLHATYKGSQLSFAVSFLRKHRRVKLVSLMAGANDVFVCETTTPEHCASPSEERAVFSTVAKNIRTIVSAIRNKAHYRGQLVIVNYYSTDYNNAVEDLGATKLNQAEDSAAKPFGVHVANGFAEFKVASFRSSNNPCVAGLLTQLGTTGRCGVHPSYAGQALLAKAVVQATRY
jgi:lysophospholipase L1-like esterase